MCAHMLEKTSLGWFPCGRKGKDEKKWGNEMGNGMTKCVLIALGAGDQGIGLPVPTNRSLFVYTFRFV